MRTARELLRVIPEAVGFVAVGLALVLPITSVAAPLSTPIATSFLTEQTALKRNLVASDVLVAELHTEETCNSFVSSQTLPVQSIEVREFSKPYQVRAASDRGANAVRLHFTLDLAVPPSGDLFLRVTSDKPDAILPVGGACQAQPRVHVVGGAEVGASAEHENRAPYLGLRCLLAVSGFPVPGDGDCSGTCLGDLRWVAYHDTTPSGWASCSGHDRLISLDRDLFGVIGTTYGTDGQSLFRTPDLVGRTPVHVGSGPGLRRVRLADVGGTDSVTLTEAELPRHTHR